jgi:hypothetical protein
VTEKEEAHAQAEQRWTDKKDGVEKKRRRAERQMCIVHSLEIDLINEYEDEDDDMSMGYEL